MPTTGRSNPLLAPTTIEQREIVPTPPLRIQVAMDTIALMSDMIRSIVINGDDDELKTVQGREMTPREQATYNAALSAIELYIDHASQDGFV